MQQQPLSIVGNVKNYLTLLIVCHKKTQKRDRFHITVKFRSVDKIYINFLVQTAKIRTTKMCEKLRKYAKIYDLIVDSRNQNPENCPISRLTILKLCQQLTLRISNLQFTS